MKRLISAVAITLSLATTSCVTAVVVRPPRPGLVLVEGRWVVPPRAGVAWVPAHWQRQGFFPPGVGGGALAVLMRETGRIGYAWTFVGS
jgi:hypothetical protein